MKKSEFKELIKEAMMEILPELMEIMVENMNETYTPTNTLLQKPDMTLINKHYGKDPGGYEDMGGNISNQQGPIPENQKGIIDGEPYASGRGIMEWFGGEDRKVKTTEFKHSSKDMDNFISNKFGVK